MLRDRARSAALLVPLLLVILWLGGPWIVAVVAVAVGVGAREAFRLLASAGYASFPALGVVLAIVVALGDAIPSMPAGAGILLAGIGIVLTGTAALTRPDPRDGLAAFATTTFGALYVGLLGFVPRLAANAPTVPGDAPLAMVGAERGWLLVLILGVWAFDTGAYAVGRRFGHRPFMHHISPAKTIEGVIGGTVAVTIVTSLLVVLLGGSLAAGA
ncbi:MAG TPA: phosphatidate cytidylyltransferase, partial [Candidatus Limnocylindrales bacterium]|nr:phosphatidate cytidylyltransferase [Candidatus Limnocylindrales bacterium]